MRHEPLEAVLPGRIDPAQLFSSGGWPVWLDSGDGSGTSYLGLGSRVATASVTDATVTLDGVTSAGSIFELLRTPVSGNENGFRLGWVGWLGYELGAETMGMPVESRQASPDAVVLFVDRALAFDHGSGEMRALALTPAGLADVTARASVAPRPSRPAPAAPVANWRYSDGAYLAMIRACQAAITEGEAYQLCLTNEAVVDIRPDPIDTYLALRESSPSHHGSFFSAAGISLLSASPEQFLGVTTAGVIQSKPIKGTRRRGITPGEDGELSRELATDEKERAENLMIVDLMRNDIARVSEVGSVSVPSLLQVESYPQVHQLVSTITGTLAAGLDPIDAVVACFPAGSMTGAPKRRAIEILDGLELRKRGAYAGAFGYFGLDGRIDLAMIIRTIVIDGAGCTVGAGGGITALSVPSAELAEAKMKAEALIAVLGVTSR